MDAYSPPRISGLALKRASVDILDDALYRLRRDNMEMQRAIVILNGNRKAIEDHVRLPSSLPLLLPQLVNDSTALS